MAGFLPLAFTNKMEKLLGGKEYERFIDSYQAPRVYGLRINRLKLDAPHWKGLSPLGEAVRPIPWAEEGFYYGEGERPGKHPHYHAGLYYIQEPSAMAPVELLDVQPGHRVLDLCAAPGGKSTQIAGKLQGSGVIVSNDNARERTKALAKNIELAGVRNAVVLNEEPAALARVFGGWFDRILVDAPCSGEGMFRKDESMIAEWEKHSVERCSVMQRSILKDAAKMLAPGGKLVYSTCTFSPEENEAQIALFLSEHPEFEVVTIMPQFGWTSGRPDWLADSETAGISDERLSSIAGTIRLWPQNIEGEGHYAALLQRKDDGEGGSGREFEEAGDAAFETRPVHGKRPDHRSGRDNGAALRAAEKRGGPGKDGKLRKTAGGKGGGASRQSDTALDPLAAWRVFAGAQLSSVFEEGATRLQAYGSRIYLQPQGLPPLDGLRVIRAGWFIGELNGRGVFEPSQPLAMGLRREEALRILNWSADDPNAVRYLKGETLFVEPPELNVLADEENGKGAETPPLKGYVLVCVNGFPLGWGKYADGGMLKNELPAGWRLI
ncbi:RsmB/NOP family class I SAM-dependent RNA methyltransferase [Paenibacillus gorillae]|uniref:RsmB/NOP family class I SAM-dependent RNA methyltransferase n=1 Tax=Paenibacillus gorillae TaxID=1243662 RepID=UPI0004AE3D3B|nr:RsmB/NOP family class I SAM-dependent RNA methyltransferase [Paenibacillus gorillae]